MNTSLKKTLNILHAPTTVGGNPQGLSKAERKLGYKSKSLTLLQNYFNYEADIVVLDNDGISIRNEIKRLFAAFTAVFKYNVIHYNFGQSILPLRTYPATQRYPKWKIFLYCDLYCRLVEFLDVKLAKLMGRVVAMTYQGDDARQGDYCIENYKISHAHEVEDGYYSAQSDALKRKRIEKINRTADLIYAVNPDLLNVLPDKARFTPYASVDPREWSYVGISEDLSVPHIVHAPSHRKVKGTHYILDTFERLEKDGIPFRYTLVENMSHADAKKVYKEADLLIDQLLAGYYGALSVELMALGKPVMCYIREDDMKHLPAQMNKDMPIINVTPDSLYETLKKYLTIDKDALRDIGKRGRTYAETWHDPLKISQDIIKDYERIYTQKHKKGRA